MPRQTGQLLLFAVSMPLLVGQVACAPIHSRNFEARLADPHTFSSVCPAIEAHADKRGDAVRRRCAAPPGPDGADAFIARQGDRITYRIDARADGRELSYLLRTRAPADMAWGSDNAEAELDLLESEHRAVLDAAVADDERAAEGESESSGATEGDAAGTSATSVGGGSAARGSAAGASKPEAGHRGTGVLRSATPEVPEDLFGIAGGIDLDGGRFGLRFWTGQSFGVDLGGSFLATSVENSTVLQLGGYAGLLIALASANDARLFLQPETGLSIFSAEGLDTAVGFHLGLGFGAEYLIARRGLPVIGLGARVMGGFERASVDTPVAGGSIDATTFGLIRGGVTVAAYFNKP